VLTWQGGASAVKHADWSALAKLAEIVIWPDADEPGIEAATELADIARSMGLDVWILDPVELARLVQVGSIPQGYDCADAVATGATRTEIQNWAKQLKIAYRPAAVVQAEVKAARTNEPEDLPTLWAQLGFAMAGKGRPAANLDNAQRALADFLQPADLHYDPFLNLIRTKDNDRLVRLSDEHMLRWTVLIQSRYGITNIQPRTVQEAVFMLAKNRQVNSLQEWLKRQTWDKTRRIDEMLITGFGAADNTFTRAVSRNFLISLAARAMQPGCQVDTMLILEGRQGLGKSRGLEALVGSERYADIDSAIGTRQHTEEIQGKWLVEISELSAFRAGDVERIKAGITRTTDVYREPFARIATDHPRQCVYAGTTNAHQYLLDDTGNRRFWPVRVSRVDRKWLTDHRGQLFAEALHEYLAGSTWWEIDTAEAEYQQQARLIGDALDDAVATVLSGRPGESITVSQILQHLELPLSQWTPQLQKRVVGALRRRGWVDRREAGVRIWSGPETPTGTPESPTGSVVVDIGSAKRRYW
jgi:predicted P-loop ATPase